MLTTWNYLDQAGCMAKLLVRVLILLNQIEEVREVIYAETRSSFKQSKY